MNIRPVFTALLLVLSIGILSGCESSEERAEKHFQTALQLLEDGDQERATVEFKNVFKLNARHREARSVFADLQRQRGNLREAASQYLQLVEQYPDDFAGNKAISEIYAEIGNWDQVDRFLESARKIDPNDQKLLGLSYVMDYRSARENEDEAATTLAVENAAGILKEIPSFLLLRQVLVDDLLQNRKYNAALDQLDVATKLDPENMRLYSMKLSILAVLEDSFGIEEQLKEMIVKFPDDENTRATLLRWYISREQLDNAEDFLRGITNDENSDPEDSLAFIQFLAQFRGQDVALDELNRMIDTKADDTILRALRAGFVFQLGDQEVAISQMRKLLEGSPSSEENVRVKIALAQMLESAGKLAESQTLIDEVLVEDATNVEAVKRKANWLIDADETSEAILMLRGALEQAPRDPNILTILARAHEREGNQDLVGEMLSLALDASNGAPTESIRYSSFLLSIGKTNVAEGVLVDALRLAPGHVGILQELGQIYVSNEDWPRAEQVQATLSRLETDQAKAASNDLMAQVLQGQKKVDAAVEFLKGLVDQGEAGIGASVVIVRNYLAAGDFEKAKEHVAGLLAADPENASIIFLDATVDAATGDLAKAEGKYQQLLDEDSDRIQAWMALYRLYLATERSAEADILLDQALAALPENQLLNWIKAGSLEARGDIAGAIATYERMYLIDSNNLVIANNLASLLTTENAESEAIQRAATISRRLRLSDVAPYQDTYGWIAYLQGDYNEAVRSLESAARSMQADPLVQFHLARAYVGNNNPKAAAAQFSKVIELTSPADTRDFVQESRAEFNRLNSELESSE